MVTAREVIEIIRNSDGSNFDEIKEKLPSGEVSRPILIQALIDAVTKIKDLEQSSPTNQDENTSLKSELESCEKTNHSLQQQLSATEAQLNLEVAKVKLVEKTNAELNQKLFNVSPPKTKRIPLCGSHWKSRKVGYRLNCDDKECNRTHLDYCDSAMCYPKRLPDCKKWHLHQESVISKSEDSAGNTEGTEQNGRPPFKGKGSSKGRNGAKKGPSSKPTPGSKKDLKQMGGKPGGKGKSKNGDEIKGLVTMVKGLAQEIADLKGRLPAIQVSG